MSDNPIYDRVENGDDLRDAYAGGQTYPDAPEQHPAGGVVSDELGPLKRRRWIYGVLAGLVGVVAIYVPSFAEHAPVWLNLASAVLLAGGTSGLVLANRNVR